MGVYYNIYDYYVSCICRLVHFVCNTHLHLYQSMNSIKWEEIFNFLNTNPQFISDSTINPDYKCKLCNHVMVKASYLPCGCEYCYKCIRNYLESNNVFCPQSLEECHNEPITISDIIINPTAIIKINKLFVKCTNRFCEFQDQIVKVVRHLETCDKAGTNCPLMEFGCQSGVIHEDTVDRHIMVNQERHLVILTNLNKDLQTRLDQMERRKGRLDNENRELKEKFDKCEIVNETLIKEIELLKEENEEMKTKLGYFGRKIENVKFGNEELKVEIVEIKKGIGNIISQFDSMKKENREIVQINKESVGAGGKACSNNNNQFTWVVESIGEKMKRDEIFWSPPFYSDTFGYKMQTGIWFGSPVEFCGRILRGENDGKLAWPCHKSIRIRIINQDTGRDYDIFDIRFDNTTGGKPTKVENAPQRWWWLGMTVAELATNSIIRNDKLVLNYEAV